jgi:acyl homoserine lactone synthase
MQVLAVPAALFEQHSNYLKQMHQLRAKVFGDRLDWDVSITEEGERDQYDDLQPTYVLAIDSGKVAGCARLLPATGPTMLQQNFSQLLRRGRLEAHPGIIESSRFCVDTNLEAGRGGGQLHLATLAMFAGIIEWSMANGYGEIVTATDLRFERILNRAGWPMHRLGEPVEIGNTIAVAGSLPADRASFDRVRPPDYKSNITSSCGSRSAA